MNFYAHYFSNTVLIVSAIVLLILCVLCLPLLKKKPPQLTSVNFAILLIVLFWCIQGKMNIGEHQNISFHLMGSTLITLMLGLPAALYVYIFVGFVYVLVFQNTYDLNALPLTVLCTVLPGLLMTELILFLSRRYLPKHLFIFIFINAFFAAAFAMLFTGVVINIGIGLLAVQASPIMWSLSYPPFFLLAWGEAFMTGMLGSIFVAFAPQLLNEYSDEFYLPKNQSLF